MATTAGISRRISAAAVLAQLRQSLALQTRQRILQPLLLLPSVQRLLVQIVRYGHPHQPAPSR